MAKAIKKKILEIKAPAIIVEMRGGSFVTNWLITNTPMTTFPKSRKVLATYSLRLFVNHFITVFFF